MSGANGSFAHMSVHVGSDWQVRCITPAGQPPLLDIDAGRHRPVGRPGRSGDPGLSG